MKSLELRQYGIALLAFVVTAASAQSQMKVEGGSGGGKEGFIAPCATRAAAGESGPVARGVWQITAPGTINYCVHAGVDGDFRQSAPSPSLPTLRTTQAPLALTVYLHDGRSSNDETWIESRDGKARPRSEVTAVKHTRHASRSASVSVSTSPSALNMLPGAWCTSKQMWGSRPKLVVQLSGASLGGRDEFNNMCVVQFDAPEPPTASLPTVLGVPAYPTRGRVVASTAKPTPNAIKSTP
jgi:hypothetical protein